MTKAGKLLALTEDTTQMPVYQERISTEMEGGKLGGYTAFNTSGKGKKIAVLIGNLKREKSYGADMLIIVGVAKSGYAIRDVLKFAEHGRHGLSIEKPYSKELVAFLKSYGKGVKW